MLNLPYPGLRPFRPDETYIYFGREKHTDDLLECLSRSRFLAVIGPSGCGKSSLINTGLMASLQLGMLASTGARWQVARMQPRGQPMKNLATALAQNSIVQSVGKARQGEEDDASFLRWVQNTLESGPLGLEEVLKRHPLPQNTNLLLVVDQFEEIFRYRRMISPDEADAFIALLLRSAGLEHYPVYVIITMRSDFLGDCTVFPGLPEAINSGQFLTPRLTREEISAAIEGPAEVYGGSVAPELVTRLLNGMRTGEDQLPVLQHALMRMWVLTLEHQRNSTVLELSEEESPPVELTNAIYREVGGLNSALSMHADEAFEELDAKGREIARIMFCALTERMKRQHDIRRPAKLSEIADVAGVEWQSVVEVAEAFRRPDRSFLVPPQQLVPELRPETELDISHESLIRQWQRLSDWVGQEFDAARIYQRLEERAALWRENKADPLGDIELRQVLEWRESWSPSEAWAKRYGRNYVLAMEFLAKSEVLSDKNRKIEMRRRENDARQKAESRYQRKRNRLMLGGFAVTGLLLVVALAGWLDARDQKSIADAAKSRADQQAEQAVLAQLSERAQRLSNDALEQNEFGRALLMTLMANHYSEEARKGELDKVDSARLLLKNFQSEPWISKIFENPSEQGRIDSVAFDPTGSQFAIGGQWANSRLGKITLRDARTGQISFHLSGHDDTVTSLAYSEDLQQLFSGSWAGDGEILRWDLESGTQLGEPISGQCLIDGIYINSLSATKQRLYAIGRHPDPSQPDKCKEAKSSVWYWELQDGQVTSDHSTIEIDGSITRLSMARDRQLLAIGTDKGKVVFWDERTSSVASVLTLPQEITAAKNIQLLALDAGGTRLAVAFDEKESKDISLWDISSLDAVAPLGTLRGHKDRIMALSFTKDSTWLASGSRDAQVLVWEIASSTNSIVEPLHTLRGHRDWVRSVAFSPDGQYLLSGSGSGRSILWSVGDQRNLYRVLPAHRDEIWSTVFAGSNGNLLVSGGKDTRLYSWNLRPINDLIDSFSARLDTQLFDTHRAPIVSQAYSSAADILLTADTRLGNSLIAGWSTGAGTLSAEPERNLALRWALSGIALSPDGSYLAVSGREGQLRLWHWEDSQWVKQVLPKLPEATGWGDNLAFSTDGELLVFAAASKDTSNYKKKGIKDNFVQLLDVPALADGGILRSSDTNQESPLREIYSVAVAGGRIAAGGDGNEVLVWKRGDSGVWALEHRMAGHDNRINSVAFSPDGKTLASGSRDRSVRLWDVRNGDHIATLEGHKNWIDQVAFSPNGKYLASASDDHDIILWKVDFSVFDEIACQVVNRNLTLEEWKTFVRDISLTPDKNIEYQVVCPKYPSGLSPDSGQIDG